MIGFLRFHARIDIFGGCSLTEGVFLFDVCEGRKGGVNIA